MGLRYQKRVNLGDGFGLNVSKSGISPSYRTKYGSIGPRGYSIRTGIPGLSFRSSFGKSKDGAMATIIIFLLIGLFIIAAIIIWNLALFLIWLTKEIYHYYLRKGFKNKLKKEIETYKNDENVLLFKFSIESLPTYIKGNKILLQNILVENESIVVNDTDIAILLVGEDEIALTSTEKGKITFYKFPGEQIINEEYIYKMELLK